MRMLIGLIAAVLLLPAAAHSGDAVWESSVAEIGLTAGFSDGPGYAGRAPTTGVQANIGSKMFRLRGGASGSLMHKTQTPGGYWVGANGGAEVRFGRFSLMGGMTTSFTDQTVWTKRVRYAYGGAGVRILGHHGPNKASRVWTDIAFVYYRETYSTYANHARVFDLQIKSDVQLGKGPMYVRLAATFGRMLFDDNPYPGAAKRQGLTSNLGVGIAWRP